MVERVFARVVSVIPVKVIKYFHNLDPSLSLASLLSCITVLSLML